jgi:hypothetical protein
MATNDFDENDSFIQKDQASAEVEYKTDTSMIFAMLLL